jgi:hypothetical protein
MILEKSIMVCLIVKQYSYPLFLLQKYLSNLIQFSFPPSQIQAFSPNNLWTAFTGHYEWENITQQDIHR